MKINKIINSIFIKFSLIFLLISFTTNLYSNNLQLKIIGNKNLDEEFIKSIVNLDQNLEEDELVNFIIKELFSTGYFNAVDANIENNLLTIILDENPVINKIRFTNNERFKDEDLKLVINKELIDIDIYNKSTVEEIKKLLIQYYKNYGYNLVEISHSTKELDNGQIDLYYKISEGEITKIKRINIIGNEYYSTRKIKSVLRSSETKFYKLVSGTSKFNENLIFIDERRIEEYYMDRGFKNIKVKSSVNEFIPDKNQVVLNYYIDEGVKFRISEIDITFNDNIPDIGIDKNEILQILDLKTNKSYNRTKIEKSADKIYDYLLNKGYIFIDVSPIDEEINDTVKLTFVVNKIDEIYVSEININGNTRTKDKIIRREVELNEGDPFIPSKVKNSRNNISRLDFFSKVDVNAISNNNKVNLDIEVKEKSTGEFNIGVLYDSYNGAALVSGLKEHNIFGVGRYLSLSLNTTSDNAGLNFEVIEPYVFNKKFNLIYNINFESSDYSSSYGYEVNKQTIGIGSRYDLTDDVSHYIKLDYSIDDYHSITSSASDSISNMSGENVQLTLTNRLSLSKLDTGFRPSEGYIVKWKNEYAIDNYMRNKISYDKYYNFNKKIFSYRTEFGNISSLSSANVEDASKFSLGGRQLRGFDKNGVGPRNSSSGYIGGNNLLSAQFDYQIPISESENNMLDLVTFFDVGKIFSNETNPTNSTESIRSSVGTGINFNTPIGPLSMTYAIPIQSESYDKERKFIFTIGWVN